MINARADTVHEKPAYRQAFASRRCLLPVDGYYEWQTVPGERARPGRQPYFVSRADGTPSPWPACTSSGATAPAPPTTRSPGG